jgi:CheY-like chemotaxis protein
MKNVLIVDDAAFVRTMLKQVLERNGFEVVGEAENGSVGVRKYKELQPDIVTMDITMPEMDGLEALKVIRKEYPKAKIVMITTSFITSHISIRPLKSVTSRLIRSNWVFRISSLLILSNQGAVAVCQHRGCPFKVTLCFFNHLAAFRSSSVCGFPISGSNLPQ